VRAQKRYGGQAGGDEFAVILSDIRDGTDVERIATDIIGALQQPFDLKDGDIGLIGASIGISLYLDAAGSAESMLQDADAAMYAAKANGRNGFRYFSAANNTADSGSTVPA
jgi:diguanylate cyclase (GGDEF)-like protein